MSGQERPSREQLEESILGRAPEFTAPEVATEAGVTIDQVRRLWRALGFPEVAGDAYFTRADVDAVARLFSTVDSGTIGFDMAVALTRALGQTMSKLADWEVATLAGRVEELEQGEDATGSRIGSALRLVDEVNPAFEDLLIYAWRRHLAAAVARMEALGAGEEDLHTTHVTVGFADIVHFTALSNKISQARIGDLVEIFEARCHDVVSNAGGRVIKSIGDSVLFVTDTAVRAFEISEGIIAVIGRDPRMPDVRLGLASGSVVTRMGDVFGPPVNLAARMTAVARRNRIIVDAATAALLPEAEFETRRLPARPVRGFGVVEPLAVRRR
ncbi:adenylate/guanylate cyclase domain-containing protein [Nocardioides solisilvae]|uniref:adenylate/guanylate cyclase domain-containing protein n=1 Tax=Nocardioides solisilvae TaxID=1542435 RepID=UPI000D744060|nr:adenylate/guanylate cyclase domain-containing protein [Nocardioides solisilvae]